jgi:hypothetical protein
LTERELFAKCVVDDILANIAGRKGIGDELHMIDDDIREEMEEELREIVLTDLADSNLS